MITIDYKSRLPIYEQLVNGIKASVIKGYFSPGEQLPSVRQLSSQLGINPNTVQRAYATLLTMGIIDAMPGKGNFITSNLDLIHSNYVAELFLQFDSICNSLIQASVTKEEIQAHLAEVLDKGGARDD